jgi:tetratricopeptide (TPR) repeat protein
MRFSGNNEPGRRRGWSGALIAAVAAILAAAPEQAAEPAWVKVTADSFEILTPAGEKVARRWATEFEQFRRGLQEIFPVPTGRLRPVTVVLFPDDRAMAPFVPLEQGRPAKAGGFFVRANEASTIMVSLARNAPETRRIIFHEAGHWHLSAREAALPLWLDEGLAEVFATFALSGPDSFTFGAAIDAHVDLLRGEKLLPLPNLLGVGRDSLLYHEGTRTGIFYAESWALAHYLFFGRQSPGRAAVQRYLELLPVVRSPDDAFLTAFDVDYQGMEHALRRYIAGGAYHTHRYPRAQDAIAGSLRLGPADPADLELAWGSLLLGTRSAAEAEPHLGRAAALAPADARAWELLGHIAMARKDFPAAQTLLGKAAAAGSRSALVYHNLAVARLPELLEPPLPGAIVDPEAMDRAAADFRRAIMLAPAHVASYEGLAGVQHGMATPLAADIELLERGRRYAPGNVMLEAGIAAGECRAGRVAAGRARLERLCAQQPDSVDPGMIYARSILASETLRADVEEINRLTADHRLDEVIATADRALARPLDPVQRQSFVAVRRRAADTQKIAAAVDLANRGRVAEARRDLRELLDHEPERSIAQEAGRLLRELEKGDERGAPGR